MLLSVAAGGRAEADGDLLRRRSIVRRMASAGSGPGAALGQIKRLVEGAPEHVAVGFSRAVRATPPERLEQVMRSPVRRVVLEAIFRQMPQRLDRRAAAGMTAAIRWCITGRADGGTDVYQVEIENGECRVRRGEGGPEPRLTITLDGAEFLRLATANSEPTQAYFKGRIALAGDVMLAARMRSLFRSPGDGATGQRSGDQSVSTVSSSR